MDNKNVKEPKLESLSGLIITRLEELKSEMKEKYNFLQVNRSRESCLFDENGCCRESNDICVNHSLAIINTDTLIGKIDYVNVVLEDQCNMSKSDFFKKYVSYHIRR